MNPSPFFADDKYKLIKMSHDSFLKAKSPEDKVIYLLDRCPTWADLFKDGEVINYTGNKRSDSIVKMFETAYELEGKILFVEDDYLWRPDTIKHIESALDTFKLVSPYDHPTHYEMQEEFNLKRVGDLVYRDGPSNTHTFATTGEYLKEHWDVFHFGVWDGEMFSKLPDKVWQPTYSFATHLVEGLLAPNINWGKLVEKYVDKS